MDIIKTIEETQKRPGAQGFNVGDTVKVYFKIIEGKTERIQVYEGIVLCKKNEGARQTFTVRKISYGVGVERVFPYNSPRIVKVDVVRPGKVRRSKLYYLRDKLVRVLRLRLLLVERLLLKSLLVTHALKLLLPLQKLRLRKSVKKLLLKRLQK